MASNDKDFATAIKGLDRVVGRAPRGVSLRGVDASSLCRDYQKIRPFLSKVLPYVEKIPMWGKQIAGAIKLLMGIADTLCPTT